MSFGLQVRIHQFLPPVFDTEAAQDYPVVFVSADGEEGHLLCEFFQFDDWMCACSDGFALSLRVAGKGGRLKEGKEEREGGRRGGGRRGEREEWEGVEEGKRATRVVFT